MTGVSTDFRKRWTEWRRTRLVALRVLLQSADEAVEVFLLFFATLKGAALEFGVVALGVGYYERLEMVVGVGVWGGRTEKSSSSDGVT